MEAATTAATAVQGMFQPTHPLKAKWHKITAPSIPRSSHSLSVVSGRAYIFGGEISPREPVSNDMHVIILPSDTVTEADYRSVPAKGKEVPQGRVGHTAAVIGDRIFVFGGRGGKDMKPLQENGRVWIYDTRTDTWDFLNPAPGTPYPPARSYHASVGMENPRPSAFNGGITEDSEHGYGTLFVHAGCLDTGRTNDLWGFDVKSLTWKEFPAAPGKPRGGTSLSVSKNRIFRFGGFNGTDEEGGQVDFLEIVSDIMSDISGEGQGEVAVSPAKVGWQTITFGNDAPSHAQGLSGGGKACPAPRSVAGLHTLTTGMGREYLLLLLGEASPSPIGHEGAGSFHTDVWAFQVPPLGATAASIKDATWQALGRETGEGRWSEIYAVDAEGREGDDVRHLVPGGRGWFGSSALGDLDPTAVVLWGGLSQRGQREGDGWISRLG